MTSGEQKRSPRVDLETEDPSRRTARVDTGERQRRQRERTRVLPAGALIADRYEVIRLLGAGGMGAVYEATQLAIGRRVAVKVLRTEVAEDPFVEQRFQREARAAASIHHPNIVVVHDFGTCDDGTLFLAMELLEGPSLLQRLRETKDVALPTREAVRIGVEIAAALEAAHAAGIVHRDLKPDNVMLPTSGGLKVLDFGIARFLDQEDEADRTQFGDRAQLTDAMQVLGTPRYISPEAVSRQRVGPPADLYALGAILFEMLAGRPVFVGNEPVVLMANHFKEKPPLLRDVAPNSDAPIALEALIDQLLKKTPAERPADAGEVHARLRALDWSGPSVANATKKRPSLGPPPTPKSLRANTPPSIASLPPLPPLAAAPAPLVLAPPPPPPRAPAPLPPLAVTPPAPTPMVPSTIFAPEEFSLDSLPAGANQREVATFQAPPAKGKIKSRSSSKAPSLIGVLITLILAGSVGTMLMRHRQRLEDARLAEEAAAAQVAAPIPQVEISVVTHTPHALVSWDGVGVVGHTFQVPLDGRTHTLTVRAAGYTPHSEELIADGPQRRTIELMRGRQ